MRIGEITAEEAASFLVGLQQAPVVSIPVGPHIGQALRLATEMRHPIYDCLYLAVALAHSTHVVTADRRFAAAAQTAYAGRVRLLGTA